MSSCDLHVLLVAHVVLSPFFDDIDEVFSTDAACASPEPLGAALEEEGFLALGSVYVAVWAVCDKRCAVDRRARRTELHLLHRSVG